MPIGVTGSSSDC